jgi:hypothetical protein
VRKKTGNMFKRLAQPSLLSVQLTAICRDTESPSVWRLDSYNTFTWIRRDAAAMGALQFILLESTTQLIITRQKQFEAVAYSGEPTVLTHYWF